MCWFPTFVGTTTCLFYGSFWKRLWCLILCPLCSSLLSSLPGLFVSVFCFAACLKWLFFFFFFFFFLGFCELKWGILLWVLEKVGEFVWILLFFECLLCVMILSACVIWWVFDWFGTVDCTVFGSWENGAK